MCLDYIGPAPRSRAMIVVELAVRQDARNRACPNRAARCLDFRETALLTIASETLLAYTATRLVAATVCPGFRGCFGFRPATGLLARYGSSFEEV